MSATTSDAMLRTRFVCYLYSFSLYRSSSSTMMMMMGIPRCKRMAGGWYSTFGTHTHTHTHTRSCWYVYMYVSCPPVLMMMLPKWNVCCVGVVHYNETWEKKEREREEKTLEEKHKHIHITLAPIIGRFHSVLLTSHRCAWSSTKKKKKTQETKK
jgi:hypothetical protein